MDFSLEIGASPTAMEVRKSRRVKYIEKISLEFQQKIRRESNLDIIETANPFLWHGICFLYRQ
jgi:hypothetical protein